MKITVYTRLNCTKCSHLIEERIYGYYDYEEKIINLNLSDKNEFVRNGFKYVPAILIEKDGKELYKKDDVTVEEFDRIMEKQK